METKDQVRQFETAYSQLIEMQNDFLRLSSKKPSESINLFKLTRINDLLQRINPILGESYRPFIDFELFEKEDLPNNSDVLIMINQYISNMKKFTEENTTNDINRGGRYWIVAGEISSERIGISYR